MDETGLGDGVMREVFSTFWDSFLARFCEGNKQFVFNASVSSDGDISSSGDRGTNHPDNVWSSQRGLSSEFLFTALAREGTPNSQQSSRGWSIYQGCNTRHPV